MRAFWVYLSLVLGVAAWGCLGRAEEIPAVSSLSGTAGDGLVDGIETLTLHIDAFQKLSRGPERLAAPEAVELKLFRILL